MFQETIRPYMQPLYDKFFAKEQALYLKELFEQNGLHPFVQEPKETFDVATGASNADMYHTLHLPQEEFAKADELILEEVKANGIPEDYYLRDLATTELEDLIGKPDEWGKQDIAVARILLAEKGITINHAHVAEKAEERYFQLNKKKHLKAPVIILLLLLSSVGYFLTLIVGPILYFMKNTDFNGKKQYVFSEETRKQGIILFIVSLVCMTVWYVFIF